MICALCCCCCLFFVFPVQATGTPAPYHQKPKIQYYYPSTPSTQKIFQSLCTILTHFIQTIANFHVLQDVPASTFDFNKVNHRVL